MIFDYLKWRGDLSFSSSSFNKIDALILSRISYFPFDNLFNGEILLKDVLNKILFSKKNLNNIIMKQDIELIKLLINSDRFSKLKITNYVNHIDIDNENQFSALTVILNKNERFVVFRGTDNSVVGWKEDFNMSFLSHIPAQLAARSYLDFSMKDNDFKFYVGGHSKGGNLAIYSSIFVDDHLKNRISKIYNFDGPGFNKDIINNTGYDKILKKIKTYIPEEAIVGILLDRKEKVKIISSNEKFVMQHDIYSWNILQKDFVYKEDISKESKQLSENLKLWLNNTSLEERKIFIDLLFSHIFNISFDMKEIVTNWQHSLSLIIKSTQDPVIVEMIQKTIKLLIKNLSLK